MYMINWLVPLLQFQVRLQTWVAVILFALGACLVIIGGYQFRKAKTTVSPLSLENTSSLVATGLYRHSRNPMYVGFSLFLAAWAVYLGSVPAMLLLPVFIWHITRVQILPEEKILEQKFGDEYREYVKNVRRWL